MCQHVTGWLAAYHFGHLLVHMGHALLIHSWLHGVCHAFILKYGRIGVDCIGAAALCSYSFVLSLSNIPWQIDHMVSIAGPAPADSPWIIVGNT